MTKLLKISCLSDHLMSDQLLAMSPATSVCPNISRPLVFDLLTQRSQIVPPKTLRSSEMVFASGLAVLGLTLRSLLSVFPSSPQSSSQPSAKSLLIPMILVFMQQSSLTQVLNQNLLGSFWCATNTFFFTLTYSYG